MELFQILKDDAVKVLHLTRRQIWKTQQWPQGWKRSFSFQSQRKHKLHSNAKECTNYSTIALKILQARLQRYMNYALPDVQAGFRKGKGTRDQITNIHQIIEKARELKKKKCTCFIDNTQAFDYEDHTKLRKALKEMGILDCLSVS